MECFSPNLVARTCEAMSSYRFLEDGEIANDGATALQSNPTIIAYGTSMLFMRDGLICSRVDATTFQDMRFTIDGQRATPDVEQELRQVFAGALAGINEVCWRYTPDSEGIGVTAYADGVENPDMADRMIWVRREDGYTLAAPAEAEET